MALARFLQISDVHLGRPFGWLPHASREDRRRDQRRALERAVVVARERAAQAILLPGDLFDQEGVDAATLNFALDVFDRQGCPPVFIAPGNHDPYSPASHYYDARVLHARGLGWPEHVHVFTSPEWSGTELPGHPDVRIWGRCFAAGGSAEQRPLSAAGLEPVVRAGLAQGVNLAVLHASREGRCPPGQKISAPFRDEELLASPFGYVALGHYHVRSEVTDGSGAARTVRAAYAGSAVALDLTETLPHGALDVAVEYGKGPPRVTCTFVELDRRKTFDLTVDLTGCRYTAPMDERVRAALEERRVGENDLVTLRLSGRVPVGVRYEPAAEIAASVFHLKLDRSRLRPEHNLDGYRGTEAPATAEERFARALLERLDKERDPEKRAVIESAAYYGLDALKLKSVVPCYEELGG